MNIKYAVLCSEGNIDRTLNVRKMKEILPEMRVVFANRNDVFDKHIALFNLEPEYDGIVIFEDDVQLCKNFKERLADVLSGHEKEVVSMFESALSKSALKSEYRSGWRFAWNQCNYYPAHVCKKLSDPSVMPLFEEYFYTKLSEPWNYPIDRYIAFVLGSAGINYWMEVPFLVQHLPLKSNFKGRPINRQSKYFIDDIKTEG